MDYTAKLDALQERVASAKTAMQSATSETREQLKERIDKAQGEPDNTGQNEEQTATDSPSTWAQLKADVATKTGEAKAKLNQRGQKTDAKVAAREADWAEAEASEALDLASWSIVSAEVAILDAIDARLQAETAAETASV